MILLKETLLSLPIIQVNNPTVVQDWWKPVNGWLYQGLLFTVLNRSVTETLTFVLDSSENKSYPDASAPQLQIGPQGQGSFPVGKYDLRSWWRVTVNTQGPTYNNANCDLLISSMRWAHVGNGT